MLNPVPVVMSFFACDSNGPLVLQKHAQWKIALRML